MLNVLDLFSGIGGFSLGLERTGKFRTIAFCEIDPFCRRVLNKHWPDVPIFGDIRKLTGEQVKAIGTVDVITGGYPCQPFSHAGKRRGGQDDRHLWPEMRRIIEEIRPAWAIGENVAGHISMGLDEVLSDLEALGYACRTFVIPACAVDAPHRRDRVWIAAYANSRFGDRKKEEIRAGGNPADVCGQVLAHSSRGKRKAGAEKQEILRTLPKDGPKHHYASGRGSAQSQGWHGEREWLPEPSVGRVADGVPSRVDRLKALGNAVVPQVVQAIGEAINEA